MPPEEIKKKLRLSIRNASKPIELKTPSNKTKRRLKELSKKIENDYLENQKKKTALTGIIYDMAFLDTISIL